MKAKKVLFVWFIFFFLLFSYGYAIDIGGSNANVSGLSDTYSSKTSYLQQNEVSVWTEAEIGDYLKFALQGSYLFDLERPVFFDLDYLHLYGVGQVSFNAGRFPVSDFTGLVLSHTLDGGRIKVALPFLTATVSVGYSGLVQKPVSTIIMSRSDVQDQSIDSKIFGSPRLIEIVEIELPELILRQDVTVSALLQQDLRSQADVVSGGGKVSSQYFGTGLSGPLFSSLYYSAYFYLGTGSYQNVTILSYLTGGRVRLYLEEALFSKVELSGLYSSGDADHVDFYEGSASGASLSFIPISRPTFGLVFSPQLGNIWLITLEYSIKPFSGTGSPVMENLQTSVKGIGYFRSTVGTISEEGIDPGSRDNYLGTEVDSRIGFRPLSDVGATLMFGVFIPNGTFSSPFLTDKREVQYKGRLELSISF